MVSASKKILASSASVRPDRKSAIKIPLSNIFHHKLILMSQVTQGFDYKIESSLFFEITKFSCAFLHDKSNLAQGVLIKNLFTN